MVMYFDDTITTLAEVVFGGALYNENAAVGRWGRGGVRGLSGAGAGGIATTRRYANNAVVNREPDIIHCELFRERVITTSVFVVEGEGGMKCNVVVLHDVYRRGKEG